MASPPIVIGPFDNVPAPGSPIRSDWPQEISHYVADPRLSGSAAFSGMNVPPNTNYVVPWLVPTNVVNPYNVLDIAASCIRIPAAGAGFWLVNVQFQWGSHGSLKAMSGWADRAGTRYGLVGTPANATEGQSVTLSAIVPAAAAATISTMAYQVNPSAVTLNLIVSCIWLGPN
jgi:hypothetical protein